jgi:hypothetical protein
MNCSAGIRKQVFGVFAVPSFIALFLFSAMLRIELAAAQVVTGTLGEPSATTI